MSADDTRLEAAGDADDGADVTRTADVANATGVTSDGTHAPNSPVSEIRFGDGSAAAGGVVWVILAGLEALPRIELLLALAPLVLVPLGLRTVRTPTRDGQTATPYRLASVIQPVGAASTVASLSSTPGTRTAVLLALPWLAVTVLMALFSGCRALPRGFRPLSELSIDAGLAYAVVGAVAILFHALGVTSWFAPTIVLLTAVHFHYAGFVVPLVTGLTGRALGEEAGPLYRILTSVVIVGPGVVGLGIAFSPVLELLAVGGFTVAVSLLGAVIVTRVAPRRPHVQGLAVGLSAVVLPISMGLALLFGLSQFLGTALFGLDIGTMVRLHGLSNAVGFALLGVLGWRLAVPESAVDSPGIPFSRLRARGRVGADFFDRCGALERSSDPPAGQVESFDVYDRTGFDAAAVDPDVRRFYEETGSYELSYDVTWAEWIAPVARLVAPITRRLEQLNLPGPDAGVRTAASRMVSLSDGADGRRDPRGWIRTDETGRAVFVSAYATHERAGVTYMNVGLPLPRSNLTAILRPEPLEPDDTGTDRSGLRLTSGRTGSVRGAVGDEGVYLATPWVPIRLPIHEEFRVRATDSTATTPERPPFADDRTDLVATHEMWLFGRQFLTITYAIARRT